MTVDEWLESLRWYLGREMTDAEITNAKTQYTENPTLALEYIKPRKNQASGTRLTRVRNQDDTDIPEKALRESN